MIKLIAYRRVSTRGQARDGYGLAAQEKDIRAYCRKRGIKIIGWEDDDKTGTLPADERPGLLACLRKVRDGQADGMVFAGALDRLARELHVQEAVLAQVWRAGGVVHSTEIGEVLADDKEDPYRTAIRQIMGVIAQLERAVLTKRMRNGKAVKAGNGGYVHGAPRFGLRAEDHELVTDAQEAGTVALIRQLAADGLGVRGIAARLNADGVPSKRGGQWHPTTVARVLERAQTA